MDRAGDLGRVRSEQVWSAAVEHLRRLIDAGELAPGSRLPAERELGERLGISRNSLRAALRVLHSIGYVEIRAGSGTYVRDREPENGPSLAALLDDPDGLIDTLFELRTTVEPALVQRLAESHSATVIAALEASVTQMERAAADQEFVRVVALDAEFHRLIAANAGHDQVAELLRSVLSLTGAERRAALQLPGQVRKACREHRAILTAIARGDADRARQRALNHLVEARERARKFAGRRDGGAA